MTDKETAREDTELVLKAPEGLDAGQEAIECRHCKGSGTCSTGEEGVSCDLCAEQARSATGFPFLKRTITSKRGLPCGVCQGTGDFTAKGRALQGNIVALLGLLIILLVLLNLLAIAATGDKYHAAIITLLGTLAGSVAGYYFKGEHTSERPKSTRRAKPKTKAAPPSSAQ